MHLCAASKLVIALINTPLPLLIARFPCTPGAKTMLLNLAL